MSIKYEQSLISRDRSQMAKKIKKLHEEERKSRLIRRGFWTKKRGLAKVSGIVIWPLFAVYAILAGFQPQDVKMVEVRPIVAGASTGEAYVEPRCGLKDFICPEEEEDQMIRSVTAYNVGDESQTDSSPCIGATGLDLCKVIESGVKVVATNELPLGSKVKINGEVYTVLDRTNARYQYRYDIAMPKDKKPEALQWGIRNLIVEPL